jgi:hypothetical protein
MPGPTWQKVRDKGVECGLIRVLIPFIRNEPSWPNYLLMDLLLMLSLNFNTWILQGIIQAIAACNLMNVGVSDCSTIYLFPSLSLSSGISTPWDTTILKTGQLVTLQFL